MNNWGHPDITASLSSSLKQDSKHRRGLFMFRPFLKLVVTYSALLSLPVSHLDLKRLMQKPDKRYSIRAIFGLCTEVASVTGFGNSEVRPFLYLTVCRHVA
jgi:hypothetical protein